MDFKQLDYLRRVVAAGSISAAAADIGMSQPALTKSIRLLEDRLGVALLVRLPRGVAPTVFGQALLRHAHAMQVQHAEALRELEVLRQGKAVTLAVGAGPAWVHRLLPEAVAKVLQTLPGLRLRVEAGFDEALLRSLRRGELDLVISELPPSDEIHDLRLRPLTTDALTVCCRAGHPLAGKAKIAATELLAYPWALPPYSTRAQSRLRALFIARDLPPPAATVETDSMDFLLRLVAASDALTYTVRTTLRLPNAAGLTSLNVPELDAARRAGIMTRSTGPLPAAAEALVTILAELCTADPTN